VAVNGVAQVRVIRCRDALEGRVLRVLGRLRRHGGVELLVVLPDGSKRMIPQAWTDAVPAAEAGSGEGVSTLGSVRDLLAVCVLVAAFSARVSGEAGQAARQSPCKEDDHAARPAQFAARAVSGASPDGVGPASRPRGHRGDHAAGPADRQGSRTGGRDDGRAGR